jgi:hypothetical protein
MHFKLDFSQRLSSRRFASALLPHNAYVNFTDRPTRPEPHFNEFLILDADDFHDFYGSGDAMSFLIYRVLDAI